MLVLL
ncbi:Protein of unknown function [Lactobacillus acidophilus DSM 20079 = JCM 1132 = NBRC 13951 = CIP 76.13]|jgi:hypothetical protein